MKIYLNPDGTWKVESEIEGIEKYEDLPEVVKRILHLAVVMLPYGEVYSIKEENEVELKICKVMGIGLADFTITTFNRGREYNYEVRIYKEALTHKEKQNEPT